MDEASFWAIVEEAGGGRKGVFRRRREPDLTEQADMLVERLRRLDPQEIVDFDRLWNDLHDRAYSWDLWGAAYVINGGCSDDCFDYFRAYLIALGREPYELGLRDPDALGERVQPEGDWEAFMDPALRAYERQTGEDMPLTPARRPREPAGEPWDGDDAAGLARRYPKLSAKFA